MHILEDALNALAHADLDNEIQRLKVQRALNFLASHVHNYNLPDTGHKDFSDIYFDSDDAKFIDACRKSFASKF